MSGAWFYTARAATAFNFNTFDGGLIENDSVTCGYVTTKINLGHALLTTPTSTFVFQSARTGHDICADGYNISGYTGSDYTGLVSSIDFVFIPNDRDATSSLASTTTSFDSSLYYQLTLNACDLYRPVSIGEGAAGSCTCTHYDGGIHNYCSAGISSGLPYLVVATTSSWPYINFVSPVDGTSTFDFYNWILNYNLPNASDTATIGVLYNTASGTLMWDNAYGQNAGENDNYILLKKYALQSPEATTSVNITATAVLKDEQLGQIVASSTITFLVEPSVIASSPCAISDGSILGDVKQAVCQVLVFVFVPSPSSINTFLGVTGSVATKPPFGYYNAIQASILTLNNGTTTALITASGTAAMAPLFSPVRTALTGLLWFLFAWWLLHRIRNFQF